MSEKQQIRTEEPECEYTAIHVANSFVEMGIARKEPLGLLQLVKFVYFAKGWHFAFYGEPLFTEQVQAWKYGPVVPSVYHAFKGNLGSDIRRPNFEVNFESGEQWAPFVRDDDRKTQKTLDTVWEIYRDLPYSMLIALTHDKNTPWEISLRPYGNIPVMEIKISDDEIKEHFVGKQRDYLRAAEKVEKQQAHG